MSVVHLSAPEEVTQSIPLRAGLSGHDEYVVVVAGSGFAGGFPQFGQRLRLHLLLLANEVSRPRGELVELRVCSSQITVLRSVGVVGHGQRDGLSHLHQCRGFADLLLGDQVDRTQLVLRTPSAPVGAPLDVALQHR
ncbi:Uncharacterised protein [Mycobacteroides abscessus subsp. abscessus]|nr:Uncharacterised protein [Mycobacteroides abscessus subsp. abscessus]